MPNIIEKTEALVMDQVSVFMGEDFLVIKIFAIIVCTGILALVVKRIGKRLLSHCQSTEHVYDDILLEALLRPLNLTVWVVGLYYAAYVVGADPAMLAQAKDVSLLGVMVWFMVRFISAFEARLEQRVQDGLVRLNRTTLRALSQLLRIAVLITATLIGLQVFGVPISGVLAFGGIGGVGVAFAAKDLLANFFGGLMIYLDRPFEVGDWIRSPDKEIEGTVEHIGWRLTRIRTFDQRPRYVPNSLFSVITLDNPSRMRNRRIKTLIGLRYDDAAKVAGVIAAVKAMLQAHEAIDTRKIMLVNLVEFGPSSLNFQVYTFTKTVDWAEYMEIQQDVFLKIIDVITEHGAECAFPTRTLHLVQPEVDPADFEAIEA